MDVSGSYQVIIPLWCEGPPGQAQGDSAHSPGISCERKSLHCTRVPLHSSVIPAAAADSAQTPLDLPFQEGFLLV